MLIRRGRPKDHECLDQTLSGSLSASQTAYHRTRKHANENSFYFFPDPDPSSDLP